MAGSNRNLPFPTALIAGVLLGALAASELSAQATVEFYHGDNGRSTVVRYDDGYRTVDVIPGRTDFDWTLKPGSTVCVNVLNAHPVLYSYALNAVVDTTSIKLPDTPDLLAVLRATLDLPRGAIARPAGALPAWLRIYADHVRALSKDIESVRSAVAASDTAERLAEARDPNAEPEHGFRSAQRTIEQMPVDPGRFNSKDLANEFAAWYHEAKSNLVPDSTGAAASELLLAVLNEHVLSLVKTRDALLKAYVGVPAAKQACAKVGTGQTTMTLQIAAKEPLASRDTGAVLLKLNVTPTFGRKSVELAPLAFMAYSSNVPQFDLVNDTVRATVDASFRYRVGAMLMINVADFKAGDIGWGAGLGFGITTSDKVLSDFFIGTALGYRDLFRVGTGVGWSLAPHGLKSPAAVDSPLPPDVKDLNDIVESRRRLSWFMLFGISGLSLK